MTKILFKLTSRSRPKRFFEAIDSILENCFSPNFTIFCSLDLDDEKMNNDEVRKQIGMYGLGSQLIVNWGTSENKVHAINRDMDLTGDWDILVNCSDDQIFTVGGFDGLIRHYMKVKFPDLDGYLHFRDSNHKQKDALCTMTIIGRKYYERDNCIYFPQFVSLWCDNFGMDLAKLRKKYLFIDEIIFDHLHPAYGKANNDLQYAHTESFWNRDKLVYQKLKAQIKNLI